MRSRASYLTHAATIGLVLTLGTAGAATAEPADVADGSELIVNGDFADGANGWRTNHPSEQLRILPQGRAFIAELTTQTSGTVVLNDKVNSVTDTGEPGQTYALSARVRTTTPKVNGALRVREVTPQGAQAHQSSFWLPTTAWHTVELTVTTSSPDAWLDVNVVGWRLSADQDLQIASVSMTQVVGDQPPSPVPAPEPEPVPEPDPAPEPQCDGPVPETTQFGTSILTGSNTPGEVAAADRAFGHVPIVRVFSPGLPRPWDHRYASEFDGRSLVTSFRAHPSEILAGKHDSQLSRWFAAAPEDRPIYWSYFHEPEPRIDDGIFTETQYKRAWEHIVRLADEACKPNMFSTLILSGWTARPASGRSLATYDAGPDVIDIVAFDPYNAIFDPASTTYTPADELLGPLVDTMKTEGHGRPWGIAEIGSRLVPGDSGHRRAEWLTDIGEYAMANDAVFVTYYHSTRDGNWRLDDRPSRAAWQDLIEMTSR